MSFGQYDAKLKSLKSLFDSKRFIVPDYQRLYSWQERNWEDFWNDLTESINLNIPHYYGTIIVKYKSLISNAPEIHEYEIIDGQQRLTTFYLFCLALYNTILKRLNDKENINISNVDLEIFKREFLQEDNFYKLELGNLNKEFFKKLIKTDCKDLPSLGKPEVQTNKLLLKVYKFFCKKLNELRNEDLKKLFDFIRSGKLFVVEFIVQDENLAIKIFEVINDRGKPLTYLDKVKSIFMFISQKYFNGSLNEEIKSAFATIFEHFDRIKSLGTTLNISYIKDNKFSEDDLLKFLYHYIAEWTKAHFKLGSVIEYNYDTNLDDIFENFIKKTIGLLIDRKSDLKTFILESVKDLQGLTISFYELLDNVYKKQNKKLYKFILFLEPDVRIWHLLVTTNYKNFLDDNLLDLIESTDLRIYKVRRTDPRAGLYNVISKLKYSYQFPKDDFYRFIHEYGNDSEFTIYLDKEVNAKNKATKYIFWELNKKEFLENFVKNLNLKISLHLAEYPDEYDIELYRKCEIEHIIAQNLKADYKDFGFIDETSYKSKINKLGNLTLLEDYLNKGSCSNRIPVEKSENCYSKSKLPYNQYFLSSYIKQFNFNESSIDKLTKEIINFCLQRWKI